MCNGKLTSNTTTFENENNNKFSYKTICFLISTNKIFKNTKLTYLHKLCTIIIIIVIIMIIIIIIIIIYWDHVSILQIIKISFLRKYTAFKGQYFLN